MSIHKESIFFDVSNDEALISSHTLYHDETNQIYTIDKDKLSAIFLKLPHVTEKDIEKAVSFLSQKNIIVTKEELKKSIPLFETKLKSLLQTKLTAASLLTTLQPILKKRTQDLFSKEESHELASVIFASGKSAKLLQTLDTDPETNIPKLFEPITTLLFTALASASPKQAKLLSSLITKLLPETKPQSYDQAKLKLFAHVFGDSFIKDSSFEGGFTPPFAKVFREFLSTQKPNVATDKVDALLEQAINLDDPELTHKTLQEKIKQTFNNPKCASSVLLYGGWQEHAVIYEIQKHPSGRYSFICHNGGEGIECNDGVDTLYKNKYLTSLKIDEILEENLFENSFLSCLHCLMKFPSAGMANLLPHHYFVHFLLPMLGGIKENFNRNATTPQRSGTCPYSCLKAFLKRTLGKEAYKALKIEFKLYLLKEYEGCLAFAAKSNITTEAEYRNRLQTKQLFACAIEKFASSLIKPEIKATKKQKEQAMLYNLRYTHLLQELSQKLEGFERAFIKDHIQFPYPLHLQMPSYQANVPQFKPGAISDFKCSNEYITTFSAIQNLPEDITDKNFSKQLEEAVLKLNGQFSQCRVQDVFYLVDLLCKKIGSISNWKKIPFSQPKGMLRALSQLASSLLNWNDDKYRAESQCMFFFTLLGIEQVFWQLPEKDRVLSTRSCYCLPNSHIADFEALFTQDPFWKGIIQDFCEMAKANQESLFTPSEDKEFHYELSKIATADITSWYNSEAAKPLREQIEARIQKDRDAQKIEIENNTKISQKLLEDIVQQITTVTNDTTLDDETKRRNLRELEWKKEQASYRLLHVATTVQESKQYWPWGFETPETEGGKSDAFRATYLFTRKHDASLPEEVHLYFTGHLFAQEFFKNNPRGKFDTLFYTFNGKAEAPFIVKVDCLNRSYSIEESESPHAASLPSNRPLKAFFKRLMKTRISEVCIPHEVHQGAIQSLLGAHLELDEAKELFALRSNPKIQIDAVLGYFQEHIEKCKDRNWIVIFHALLFESNYLQKELSSSSSRLYLLPKLKAFFTHSIKRALIQEEFTQAANLLWLSQLVQHHLTKECTDQIVEQELFIQIVDDVLHPRYAHHWPDLFEAFFAASQAHIKVSDACMMYAVFAHIMRQFNPVAVKEQFSLRKEGALLSQAKLLITLSQANDAEKELLQKAANTTLIPLLQKIFPNLSLKEFTFINQTTLQAKDDTLVSLTSGSVTPCDPNAIRVFNKPLSEEAMQRLKQELFPDEQTLSSLRCYIEGDYITARHEKSDTKVKFASYYQNAFWIKTPEIDWGYLIPKNSRYYLANQELRQNYHHVFFANQIYLLDRESFKSIYSVSHVTGKISTCDPNETLVLATCCPIPELCRFEDPTWITTLLDAQDEVAKIHLFRHQLTFIAQKEQTNTCFRLKEESDWFLAKDGYLPEFGLETGYIVLENEKQAKKVLLPILKAVSEDKASLTFSYQYDFASNELQAVRHVEFDLVETTLVPKSLEARMYLALIACEKGNLDLAEELLFSIKAEISYRAHTKEENDLLLRFVFKSQSKNAFSRAFKLRLRALYLLEKNGAQFPQTQQQINTQEAHKLVQEYFARLGHMEPLASFEERFLLERLQERSSNDSHKRRYGLRILALDGIPDAEEAYKTTYENQTAGIHLPVGSPNLIYANATEQDKKEYRDKRIEKRFPFDPQRISLDEFKAYFRLLEEEIDNTTSWNEARQNGLLSAMYVMGLFSQDWALKKDAGILLRKLLVNIKSFSFARNREHFFLPPKELPGQTLAQRGIHELVALREIDFAPNPTDFGAYLQKEARKTDANAITHTQKIFHTDHPEVKDEATKNYFEKIAKSIQAGADDAPASLFHLKEGKSIDALKIELKEALVGESEKLLEQEHLIRQGLGLLLASDIHFQHSQTAKRRKVPSIHELCLLAAKPDAKERFKALFGELTEASIKTLMQAIQQHMLQKRHVQQLQDLLKKAENNEMDELGQEIDKKAAYDIASDAYANVFLLIEVLLQIRLRSDQVDSIRAIVKSLENNEPIAIQLIMGAGKTSIIQPLLAFLLIRPGMLSSVVVPEALLEPILQNLANLLPDTFQQHLFYMPFDATLAEDIQYLQAYCSQLQEAKKRGSCALFTPRQKHSLITGLYKAFHEVLINDNALTKKRVDLFSKICGQLQLTEIDQIDEIDQILNSNVIFKSPLGAKKVIDFDRASIVSELLIELVKDEPLQKLVSIDFMSRFWQRKQGPSQDARPELTKELFKSVVQPRLVGHAKKLLLAKDPIFAKVISSEFLTHLLSGTSPYDEEIQTLLLPEEEILLTKTLPKAMKELEALLWQTHDKTRCLVAQKQLYRLKMIAYFEAEIKEEAKLSLLGALAKATSIILPQSLLKECGTHYGADPETGKYVARPYDGARNPRPTIYADAYQQVIFTLQLAFYYGVPRDAVEKLLQSYQLRAKTDIKDTSCQLPEVKSYQRLVALVGEPIKQVQFLQIEGTHPFVDILKTAIDTDPSMLLEFMQNLVFNQIVLFTESYSSTPQTVVGSSNQACGYSGTHQEGLFPRGMKAQLQEGTDGKTILAIEKKMLSGESQVLRFSERNQKKLSLQVIDCFCNIEDLHVFIDCCGWLKDETIESYAEALLLACEQSQKRTRIKAIIYHDKSGKILMLMRNSLGQMAVLPYSAARAKEINFEHLTIIMRRYETGTHILQKRKAKALLSVRKNMNLLATLQSSSRMREVLLSQSIIFGVNDEVNNHVASGIINGLLSRKAFRKLFSTTDTTSPQEVLDSYTLEPKLKSWLAGSFQERRLLPVLTQFCRQFEVDSGALWRYFAVNQSTGDQERSWLAVPQRMRETLELPIRKVLTNDELPIQLRSKLIHSVRDLLLLHHDDRPWDMLKQGLTYSPIRAAVDDEIAFHLALFDKTQKLDFKIRDAVIKELERCYNRGNPLYTPRFFLATLLQACANLKFLAAYVMRNATNQFFELEQEQERERELEPRAHLSKIEKKSYLELAPYTEDGTGYDFEQFLEVPFVSLQEFLPPDVLLPHMHMITCSPNLFLENAHLGSCILASYHIPVRYILVVKEDGTPVRYILLSHQDAGLIKNSLNAQTTKKAVLFALDGTVCAATHNDAIELATNEETQLVTLQAKLCTSKANFTPSDVTQISALYENFDDGKLLLQKLKKFYEDCVRFTPATCKKYSASPLKQFFHKATLE